MKAIGYTKSLPIEDEKSLQDIELTTPKASGKDILVEVKAIAVNPVDYKVRQRATPEAGEWKILGWDATGIVTEVGEEVSLFQPGDEVWYAGDLTRSGSYAAFQLVDERIVGKKPDSLSFSEAAALPLTTLTAWELLFDRMEVDAKDPNKSILGHRSRGRSGIHFGSIGQATHSAYPHWNGVSGINNCLAKRTGSRSCDQPSQ